MFKTTKNVNVRNVELWLTLDHCQYTCIYENEFKDKVHQWIAWCPGPTFFISYNFTGMVTMMWCWQKKLYSCSIFYLFVRYVTIKICWNIKLINFFKLLEVIYTLMNFWFHDNIKDVIVHHTTWQSLKRFICLSLSKLVGHSLF